MRCVPLDNYVCSYPNTTYRGLLHSYLVSYFYVLKELVSVFIRSIHKLVILSGFSNLPIIYSGLHLITRYLCEYVIISLSLLGIGSVKAFFREIQTNLTIGTCLEAVKLKYSL